MSPYDLTPTLLQTSWRGELSRRREGALDGAMRFGTGIAWGGYYFGGRVVRAGRRYPLRRFLREPQGRDPLPGRARVCRALRDSWGLRGGVDHSLAAARPSPLTERDCGALAVDPGLRRTGTWLSFARATSAAGGRLRTVPRRILVRRSVRGAPRLPRLASMRPGA